MEEIQKIIKAAIEAADKGQNKHKVFEDARIKLLKLQEKHYSEKKSLAESDLHILDEVKELAKRLGVKYKDYDEL